MNEGERNIPTGEVVQLRDHHERRDAGPREAEIFLAEKDLPHHEQSIRNFDDEYKLYELINVVNDLDAEMVKNIQEAEAIEDKEDREMKLRSLREHGHKLKHLGYLKEVSRRRIAQLEMRRLAA